MNKLTNPPMIVCAIIAFICAAGTTFYEIYEKYGYYQQGYYVDAEMIVTAVLFITVFTMCGILIGMSYNDADSATPKDR